MPNGEDFSIELTHDVECGCDHPAPDSRGHLVFTFDCPKCGVLCIYENGAAKEFRITLPGGREVPPSGFIELPDPGVV